MLYFMFKMRRIYEYIYIHVYSNIERKKERKIVFKKLKSIAKKKEFDLVSFFL